VRGRHQIPVIWPRTIDQRTDLLAGATITLTDAPHRRRPSDSRSAA